VSAARTLGRFDAFRLARDRAVLTGSVDATALPRLADRVIGAQGPVEWRIEGTVDAMDRLALTVRLEGTVTLECQRCLEALEWPIAQQTQLLLAHDDAQAERLDAESDAEVLVAATAIDPQTLVEDELVLALPYIARHPDGSCEPPSA
jgi:uncharacterized protein